MDCTPANPLNQCSFPRHSLPSTSYPPSDLSLIPLLQFFPSCSTSGASSSTNPPRVLQRSAEGLPVKSIKLFHNVLLFYVDLICVQESNLNFFSYFITTHIRLYDFVAFTPGLALFFLMIRSAVVESSFSSDSGYPFVNFQPSLSLCLAPSVLRGDQQFSETIFWLFRYFLKQFFDSSLAFLKVYAPPIFPFLQVVEPIHFPCSPFLQKSFILGEFNCDTLRGTQEVFRPSWG